MPKVISFKQYQNLWDLHDYQQEKASRYEELAKRQSWIIEALLNYAESLEEYIEVLEGKKLVQKNEEQIERDWVQREVN